ncbi:MAG: ABC transporter permease, partial [Eubacterium sp.]|nr:ABC transporter permease [Eubacterium sp.]
MQVFKLFFKIAKSKLPSGLIYIIVFFAVCFPLVKVATKEFNFEDTSIDITIYDEDNTAESKSLIDSIAKNNTIKEINKDSQVILDAMYYEQVDYCLTIKKGYAEKLAKTDVADMKDSLFETYHLHDSYATAMMQQYLDEYVRMTRSFIKSGNDVSEAIKKTEEKIGIQADISFAEFDSGDVKDENYGEGIASIFRYLPYLLISVLLNVLSPVLLVLKKKDQRYRMNCSSLPSSKYIIQIFAGSALIVL